MWGVQADSSWRKVMPKLEGEPAFEDMDKAERVEVFADYLRCGAGGAPSLSPKP